MVGAGLPGGVTKRKRPAVAGWGRRHGLDEGFRIQPQGSGSPFRNQGGEQQDPICMLRDPSGKGSGKDAWEICGSG